ncbi:MAG: metallophosphoesterase family protein [Pseudomonadota bacterium]|nr:metallophosphoesterase family protein [Pseudomonadota bacterium]MEC7537752.1 metallophosphoesterase family protein [Pseudomonadota bacterium]MEC7648926.1 metallophosphoesterase family protein [Pseudomonadota bacterium]MEC8172837.1 metallophosphoesterase family protein [Pseudomonadota bacterium]MEC8698350.1 metallophosphoesterase family protein [Pseudomonadota bacterium]
MLLGIVSDLHCNIQGLDKALELMGDVDQVLCLGDTIYEYRFSNEVIARLIEIGAPTIQGNHEETFLGPMGVRARAREGIDPDLMQWLAERPHRLELDCDGKKVLMVHSTPWEPRGAYIYRHSPELERFGEADAEFVLFGHTHQQVIHRAGDVLVINPGSAGDARDPDNGRQLSCAVLDTETEEARIIDYPDPARA